jgi:putative tryptophan/tyrosine transport system substrate-binding protein
MQLDVLWPAVDTPEQYEPAFAMIVRDRANAVILGGTALNEYHARRVADFALTQKLPSISPYYAFAEAGGLLSYGARGDNADTYRHVVAYVKKILDGAKPGDLPFEQPTKFELVINLKTAQLLGLTIPKTLLARADRVIQ